eukprot:m.208580 g.208580  ORF g.208580 m.208580 type:complete len:317 (+) comp24181_c0_seq1:109-1059(+)
MSAVRPFRVLTVNVGLLRARLFGKTVFQNPPFADERLPHICARLAQIATEDKAPDLIALQEVYEPAHWDAIRDAMMHTHPHTARREPKKNKLKFHNGLALLSRHEIGDVKFKKFKKNIPLEEALADKGFLCATVDMPALCGGRLPIKVVNMHLTAGGTEPDNATANRVRALQVAECAEEAPDLVIGDLNAGPEASPDNYEYALSLGFACGYRESGGCDFDAGGHTWDPLNPLNANGVHGHMPPERIDHVLRRASGGPLLTARATRAEVLFREPIVPLLHGPHAGKTVTISDHYGLMVEYSTSSPSSLVEDVVEEAL